MSISGMAKYIARGLSC